MLKRGTRIEYVSNTPKFDPLHQLTGTVTHLTGDNANGEHYKARNDEVWVVWDNDSRPPCWVSNTSLRKV
jgi:hypothetical protein